MYKSPIEIITSRMLAEMDGEILKAVQKYGITVDKEELTRALEYDRNQYSRGYVDGKADAVVHGRWVVEHEESVRCSECCFNRASIKIPMDYCPNCGAKMDGERKNE